MANLKKILKNRFLSAGILCLLAGILLVFLLNYPDGTGQKTIDFAASKESEEADDFDVEIIDENPIAGDEEKIETEEEILEEDFENLEVFDEEKENIADKPVENYQSNPALLAPPLDKKSNPNKIKIGFITDLHVRSIFEAGNSLEANYIKRINYFVERMNNVFTPDMILLNGDIIEGTGISPATGSKELGSVKRLLDRTTIKKYWVPGNHDLRSVTKAGWKKSLAVDYTSKSFSVGNYKIILLDTNFTKNDIDISPGNPFTRGKVSEKQIGWLRNELEKTEKKVLVFMHHPPLRSLEAKQDVNLLFNARVLQEIFSQYGVLAVFSGHIEDLYFKEIGGVNYIVTPGLTKHPAYQGAFSEISFDGDKISIFLNYLKADGSYRRITVKK